MARRTAALAAILVLATGCAADHPALVDRLANGRVIGDQDRVVVQGGRLDALPLAVLHCARYGRSAQFASSDAQHSTFRCVPKPG